MDQSIMSHSFARVPRAEIPRSSFDRSFKHVTALYAGYLIPVLVDEALPGDTFNVRMNAFARLATPLKPFMDNLYVDSFFFSVPIRLVWDNFRKFQGEQVDPGDSTDFLIPQIVAGPTGVEVNGLSDYFGIPVGVPNLSFSALWHRAYNLVYNEWFRDQNVINSVPVPKGDGPDAESLFPIRRRGKRHDYFTSCLPWPQKGVEATLPLGDTAPVLSTYQAPLMRYASGGSDFGLYTPGEPSNTPDAFVKVGGMSPTEPSDVMFGSRSGLYTDLDEATAATINTLRRAFAVQRLYERDARGGTRYAEIVRSHFGVIHPDQSWRSEYLGGGSSPVNLHPVAQATPSSGGTPQGNLAAFGTASFQGHSFTKSFTEHSLIIGLVSVRGDLTYQQGLPRMFSRRTRFDIFMPALAHLGEQAVLNKELYAQGTAADDEVFGYQERWAEYRYKPSQVTSVMRSSHPQSLDVWHLSQEFGNLPVLNHEFIEERPPVDRVVAVPSEPHFLADFFFDMTTARPMPVYSVPGMIDHF